jgi:serine/threonine-protein kinase
VNRQGHEEPIRGAVPRQYTYPRLSPDGRRVALDIRDQESDIWILDLARDTLTRFTFDPLNDTYPVWTPDGKRIIHATGASNGSGGSGDLKAASADGTGRAESLMTGANVIPTSISPDGTTVIVRDPGVKGGTDLSIVRLGGPSTAIGAGKPRVEKLIQTSFTEINGEVSPDGRWLAYQSNASGQEQIYVQPFPNVNGGRWQISTAGGAKPLWARNGRELFYFDPGGVLMAVAIQAATTFSAGNPAKLLDAKYFVGGPNVGGRTYDVSPDGQRFLMIKDNASGNPGAASANMVVVLNWTEELKARLPVR